MEGTAGADCVPRSGDSEGEPLTLDVEEKDGEIVDEGAADMLPPPPPPAPISGGEAVAIIEPVTASAERVAPMAGEAVAAAMDTLAEAVGVSPNC